MISCEHHAEEPAVGFCRKCQSNICEKCVVVVEGKKRCRICYEKAIAQRMSESQAMRKLTCGQCGNRNDIDSGFCSKCGNQLKPLLQETKSTEPLPENISETNATNNPNVMLQSHDRGSPAKKTATGASFASAVSVHHSWQFDVRRQIAQWMTVSIVSALVSLILFSFILKGISSELSYSKALILMLAFVALALAGITLFFIVKNFKAMRSKSALQLLTALCLIFITFSVSAFRENSRILNLERSYQNAIALINAKDWRRAIASLEYLASNSEDFKSVASLLDSSRSSLNHLVADSCLQVAHNLIRVPLVESNLSDAISAIDKAKSLLGNEYKVNNAYYLASKGLLKKAEHEYRKNEYENALTYARQSLTQMTALPKNSFNDLSYNINRANEISTKAQSKLDQIRREQERSRQKEVAAERARERAQEATGAERGREMAAAFSIWAVQGKKDDIGWILRVDLTNILEKFGYYGYNIIGGTKVELYDGIIYQAECTKNNSYYYAYLKSNLSYDRWSVIGVYSRRD